MNLAQNITYNFRPLYSELMTKLTDIKKESFWTNLSYKIPHQLLTEFSRESRLKKRSESVFLGSLHSNLAYLKFPQVWTNKSLSELKLERKHDRAGFNPVKNQVLAPCVNSSSRSSGMSHSISNNRFSLDNPSFINLHEKQGL